MANADGLEARCREWLSAEAAWWDSRGIGSPPGETVPAASDRLLAASKRLLEACTTAAAKSLRLALKNLVAKLDGPDSVDGEVYVVRSRASDLLAAMAVGPATKDQRRAARAKHVPDILRKLLEAEERGQLFLTLANLGGERVRNATRIAIDAGLIARPRRSCFELRPAGREIAKEARKAQESLAPKLRPLRASRG